jgi:hypothetical protein
MAQRAYYTLADEHRPTILVACSKCPWSAAFAREDLLATHGLDYPMPTLLDHLAMPGCQRVGNQWDRCGVLLSLSNRMNCRLHASFKSFTGDYPDEHKDAERCKPQF